MTLKKHYNKWSDCDRCPIANKRKVFYAGDSKPDYLFITSHPGAAESFLSSPVTGELREIFTELMKDVTERVTRVSYGITTLVSCVPWKGVQCKAVGEPTDAEIKNAFRS